MSSSFDDGQWAKWCAESLLLLLQHLQRLKQNDRVCRQVVQKLTEDQSVRLIRMIDQTPSAAVIKEEPGEASSEAGSAAPLSMRLSAGLHNKIDIEHTVFIFDSFGTPCSHNDPPCNNHPSPRLGRECMGL